MSITNPLAYRMSVAMTIAVVIIAFTTPGFAARWNQETTNWNNNPNPVVGDWGFNRPGYPSGLYVHGVTVPNGEIIENPVIYDNDITRDVLDDEWTFVMSSLGELNLVGYICTPLEGGNKCVSGFMNEFINDYNRANGSNMCMERIPYPVQGNGCTYGTGPNWSPGAQVYLDVCAQADPNRPVIVNIGGQGTTLAAAWSLDHSIADKIIVYYTDITEFNGHETWGSTIVAQNFRVINFGRKYTWWEDENCQNEWQVLPRPNTCCPGTNQSEWGEWNLINNGTPLMDFFISQMNSQCWYVPTQCGGCTGHNWGSTSDGYFDGTHIAAWAPGMITGIKLDPARNGEVLYITSWSKPPVKAVTLNALQNQDAFDGQCPVGLQAPAITSIDAPSSDTVTLTWQDNSSDPQEDGFFIERRPHLNEDTWEQVGSVGQNQTSFTDTDNLHGLVEYTYRVGAYKN